MDTDEESVASTDWYHDLAYSARPNFANLCIGWQCACCKRVMLGYRWSLQIRDGPDLFSQCECTPIDWALKCPSQRTHHSGSPHERQHHIYLLLQRVLDYCAGTTNPLRLSTVAGTTVQTDGLSMPSGSTTVSASTQNDDFIRPALHDAS